MPDSLQSWPLNSSNVQYLSAKTCEHINLSSYILAISESIYPGVGLSSDEVASESKELSILAKKYYKKKFCKNVFDSETIKFVP